MKRAGYLAPGDLTAVAAPSPLLCSLHSSSWADRVPTPLFYASLTSHSLPSPFSKLARASSAPGGTIATGVATASEAQARQEARVRASRAPPTPAGVKPPSRGSGAHASVPTTDPQPWLWMAVGAGLLALGGVVGAHLGGSPCPFVHK